MTEACERTEEDEALAWWNQYRFNGSGRDAAVSAYLAAARSRRDELECLRHDYEILADVVKFLLDIMDSCERDFPDVKATSDYHGHCDPPRARLRQLLAKHYKRAATKTPRGPEGYPNPATALSEIVAERYQWFETGPSIIEELAKRGFKVVEAP